MADTNTVVIISDRADLINKISSKLVLLRTLDKIKSCSFQETTSTFEGCSPNVLIIHCEKNNKSTIELIRRIKSQQLYKNIPILLLNDNCSRETIIEAFDLGISDVLFMPIIDYELLIRVIWCLKKNETNMSIESRTNFLTNLGVVQSDTGVYTQKYCDEFLKNEIAQTRRYSQRACLLLLSPDKKYSDYKSPREFISVIKKSIRLNDSIVIKDVDQFYLYLQKTKLNGAYSVFERINKELGNNCGANAGVVEIQDQKYDDIKEALEAALNKANENTNSLIVASDFYSHESKPLLNIKSSAEFDENEQDNIKIEQQNDKKGNFYGGFDKNSSKLFNQVFQKKLKVVVMPVFKKIENILRTKKEDFAINSYIGNKSSFNVSSDELNASFQMDYDGLQHVLIRLTIMDKDQKRLYETETVDFTILDYRRLSLMLSELIDKFIIILKKKS